MSFVLGLVFDRATISKNLETTEDNTDYTNILNAMRDQVNQYNNELPFSELKVPAKVQALKSRIRERTKKRTDHIQHYCKSAHAVTQAGGHLYFDFMHSFLYCQTAKVRSGL